MGFPVDWTTWRATIDVDAYDRRWERRAAAGDDVHGEADLVASYRPRTVLDAGCGTGRVAIELARRGVDVVGVDADPDMLARARAKAPGLTWAEADLATLDLGRTFDVVLLAGNVLPYVAAADRPAAAAACARHVRPGGRLVQGCALQPGWPTLPDLESWLAAAGHAVTDRWATWDRAPYDGGPYVVLVSG